MKNFKLKCGNLGLSCENNEFSEERKEIKKAWNWDIDQVWEKFHKDKSDAMHYILQDYYMTFVKYILGQIEEIKYLGTDEFCDIYNAGLDAVYGAIDAFEQGGDEKFESYCTPRIRLAMFDKVRSKVIKRRLGDNGEKIDFGQLKHLPAVSSKKGKTSRKVAPVINTEINKNYLCHKCETLTQGPERPKDLNCPEGGSHEWTDLGNVGNENYHCKKCDVVVEASRCPASCKCPIGGDHQWTELGKVGYNNNFCKKCGVQAMTERKPTSLNCSEGGLHQWTAD